jgi:hypothetical protein
VRLLQGRPRLRPRARCVCGKSRRALRHVRARFSGVPVEHARTETGQLLAPTGTIAHAEATQAGHSNTSGEREEACDLIAMQSDRMLRAKIRDLMASGLLPRVQSDGSLVDEAGRSVPGQRHVGRGVRSQMLPPGTTLWDLIVQHPYWTLGLSGLGWCACVDLVAELLRAARLLGPRRPVGVAVHGAQDRARGIRLSSVWARGGMTFRRRGAMACTTPRVMRSWRISSTHARPIFQSWPSVFADARLGRLHGASFVITGEGIEITNKCGAGSGKRVRVTR